MHFPVRSGQYCLCGLAAALLVIPTAAIGCGGSAVSSSTTTGTTTTNPYALAYKSLAWGATVTVSFPSSCEITITTTGQPDYTPNAYYLAPASGTDTVVAHTAVSNTALTLISYATTIKPSLQGATVTLNDCPTKASATTAASTIPERKLLLIVDLLGLFRGPHVQAPAALMSLSPAREHSRWFRNRDSSRNCLTQTCAIED